MQLIADQLRKSCSFCTLWIRIATKIFENPWTLALGDIEICYHGLCSILEHKFVIVRSKNSGSAVQRYMQNYQIFSTNCGRACKEHQSFIGCMEFKPYTSSAEPHSGHGLLNFFELSETISIIFCFNSK